MRLTSGLAPKRAWLLALVVALGASGSAAEEAKQERSDAWLGRLVVLEAKDGALRLDQEAWTRWQEAQPPRDDSPEGKRKRLAERYGMSPDQVPEELLRDFQDEDLPPVATLFQSLVQSLSGRGGCGSSISGAWSEFHAERPGFRAELVFDGAKRTGMLDLQEEVGPMRHLRVELSSDELLTVSLQGDGRSVLLACWPDGVVAISATCTGRTLRATGKRIEDAARSAPEDFAECVVRPLLEVGIKLPDIDGVAAPKDVRARPLDANPDEARRVVKEAAKQVDTSIATIEGHSGAHYAVAFSPDGSTLLVGCADGAISLRSTATWEETRRFEGTGKAGVFAADGHRVAAWEAGQGVAIVDLESGEIARHEVHAEWARFSPQGDVLYVAEMERGARGITAFEAAPWRVLWRCEVSDDAGYGNDFALSPDGKAVAAAFTSSMDGQVLLWDTADGKHLKTLEGHRYGAYGVAFGEDAGVVISGGRLGDLRRWDAATGEVRLLLEMGSGSLQCIAANSTGDLVARGDRDAVTKVREAATGRLVAALRGHVGRVESLAWSPDGALLATGSEDGTAKVWRVGK